jgi:poly(A) polymerase
MSSEALRVARAALAGHESWLIGGAVRDRALERVSTDLDVVLEGDPGAAARAVARAARQAGMPAASFPLSEEFGAWRVVARDGSWQIDVERLRGGSLHADLGLRDFTVNAIAEPLAGGAPVDPLGGLEDLRARRLRMAGAHAFADDPLRVLRLVRVAVQLGLEPESRTFASARQQASRLSEVSPERVFAELHRTLASADALRGLELMGRLGVTQVVLPELDGTRGVQQSQYHHRDVYGHTLEVLERTIDLQADPAAILGVEHAEALAALLAEPLADGLTRGDALRWGALLHDVAKPATRSVRPADGRVTFVGHDAQGADLALEVLGRLRVSVRLRQHVAALVRHHLRLGFLVHEPQPLASELMFDYLYATDPVEADVTLLSVADRLATRGQGSEGSIEAHLRLACQVLAGALRWRSEGPPKPLLRGDELAGELELKPGPRLGELLHELARAQYAGRVSSREQAIAFARELQSPIGSGAR